jgi:hypothetical protein
MDVAITADDRPFDGFGEVLVSGAARFATSDATLRAMGRVG